MSAIPPSLPPSGPVPSPAQAAGTVTVVSDPRALLTRLVAGTVIEATTATTGTAPKTTVTLNSADGSLQVKLPLALPAGTRIQLQVIEAGDTGQLRLISVNGQPTLPPGQMAPTDLAARETSGPGFSGPGAVMANDTDSLGDSSAAVPKGASSIADPMTASPARGILATVVSSQTTHTDSNAARPLPTGTVFTVRIAAIQSPGPPARTAGVDSSGDPNQAPGTGNPTADRLTSVQSARQAYGQSAPQAAAAGSAAAPTSPSPPPIPTPAVRQQIAAALPEATPSAAAIEDPPFLPSAPLAPTTPARTTGVSSPSLPPTARLSLGAHEPAAPLVEPALGSPRLSPSPTLGLTPLPDHGTLIAADPAAVVLRSASVPTVAATPVPSERAVSQPPAAPAAEPSPTATATPLPPAASPAQQRTDAAPPRTPQASPPTPVATESPATAPRSGAVLPPPASASAAAAVQTVSATPGGASSAGSDGTVATPAIPTPVGSAIPSGAPQPLLEQTTGTAPAPTTPASGPLNAADDPDQADLSLPIAAAPARNPATGTVSPPTGPAESGSAPPRPAPARFDDALPSAPTGQTRLTPPAPDGSVSPPRSVPSEAAEVTASTPTTQGQTVQPYVEEASSGDAPTAPPAEESIANTPPSAPALLPESLTGLVAPNTHAGLPLVQTSLGLLSLATATGLPAGTLVTLEPLDDPTLPTAAANATSVRRSPPGANFGETIDLLRQVAPRTILPTAAAGQDLTPRLLEALIGLTAAVEAADIRPWLGDRLVKTLVKAGRGDLIEALDRDFGALKTMVRMPLAGEWQCLVLPLPLGQRVEPIRLVVRRSPGDAGEAETREDEGTRFLVDIDMSRLGPLQLDGLIRRRTKRFDIILRSHVILPETVRQDIAAIFARSLEGLDLVGSASFQRTPTFIEPLPMAPQSFSGWVI